MSTIDDSRLSALEGNFLVRVAGYTGKNPQSLGMGPVPPGLKLAGLVDAVQQLVQAIRDYFPVSGVVSAYGGDTCSVARTDEVGLAFDAVENWLNPDRLPFSNPLRRDPDQICGVPEGTLQHRLLLRETISRLVERYDAVLTHYRIEQICECRDFALMWWNFWVTEIGSSLLERIQKATECLESHMDASHHLYLDRVWCELHPDSAAVADYRGATTESAASELQGQAEEAKSGGDHRGFLGLILIEKERVVRRQGYNESISLGNSQILWDLLVALISSGEERLGMADLKEKVWKSNTLVDDNAVQKQVSSLRKVLRRIGIEIHTLRQLGYRLKDLSVAN